MSGSPKTAACSRRWKAGIRAIIDWWHDMGPEGFQESLVYLRTAYSVDPRGWAKFDYVKMPDYRWGMLLAPQEENRVVPFGEHFGEPAWQEVPGEYRAMLRRLVVIQGDTEPASVEQQRHLGKTAPSLYDMRNLFQVNVEEGRHLWAMVYLLQKYFGRDGREEADESAAPPLRLGRRAAHARRVQRGDAGLAVVLHVHLLHRPRRQDAAALAGAIRLRPAVAHLPLHADRGSAPHVRRRDRHQPRGAAHLRRHEGGRHRGPDRRREGAGARRDRPADDPEEAQPALHALARPVRLGGLDQCGERLQFRPEGPLSRDADRGRSPAEERHLSGAQAGRTARSGASTSRR